MTLDITNLEQLKKYIEENGDPNPVRESISDCDEFKIGDLTFTYLHDERSDEYWHYIYKLTDGKVTTKVGWSVSYDSQEGCWFDYLEIEDVYYMDQKMVLTWVFVPNAVVE